MKVEDDYLLELKQHLERVMIILEDNPKIKDVADFYTGKDLAFETAQHLREFNKVGIKEE